MYLEELGSNSALHFCDWCIGSYPYEATNESQRLKLSLRRKHALVKTLVFDRHSMECFLFDKRKTYRVSCTQTSCFLTAFVIIIIIFISDSDNINHTKLVVQSEGCQRSLCSLTGRPNKKKDVPQ